MQTSWTRLIYKRLHCSAGLHLPSHNQLSSFICTAIRIVNTSTGCQLRSQIRFSAYSINFTTFATHFTDNAAVMKTFTTVAALAALSSTAFAATVTIKETPCLQESVLEQYIVELDKLVVQGRSDRDSRPFQTILTRIQR